MRVAGLVVGMALLFGAHLGAQAAECETPLPEFEVKRPASDVPQERARFVGIWKGKWEGKLCHTFVVEWVEGDEAQVIYSFGVYEPWNIKKPGKGRYVARFDGENLRLPTFRNGADASYRFEQGGLRGRYVTSRGGVSYVKLTKVSD